MIRDGVYVIAQQAASQLPRLQAKGESMLAEVLGSLRAPVVEGGEPLTVTKMALYADQSTAGVNEAAIQAAVDTAAEVIRATKDLAKTVVNPAILAAANEAQAIINGRAAEFCIEAATVQSIPTEGVWSGFTLYESVKAYESAAAENIAATGYLMGCSPDTFPIDAFLNSIPSASLQNEYRETFASLGNGLAQVTDTFNLLFADRERRTLDQVETAVPAWARPFFHLTALYLAKALLAPTSELAAAVTFVADNVGSHGQLGEFASKLVEQMSIRVFQDIAKKVRASKQNRTDVFYYNQTGADGKTPVRVAAVDQDAYNKALEAGTLTPEMMMGSAVGKAYATLEDVIAHGAECQALYERVHATNKLRQEAVRLMVAKDALVQGCLNAIQQLDPIFLQQPLDVYFAQAREYIGGLGISDVDDMIPTIRNVICCCVFANTEVCEFLCAMDKAGRDLGLSPRECARVAAEDMLARWLADMIQVAE